MIPGELEAIAAGLSEDGQIALAIQVATEVAGALRSLALSLTLDQARGLSAQLRELVETVEGKPH